MASDTGRRRGRRGTGSLAVTVVRHTYRSDASYMAASLSYYALTALMPAVLLAFVGAATFWETEIAREVVLAAANVLTPRGRAFVLEAVTDVAERTGIAAFAALVAVGSSVQLFRTLERAFAFVYGTDRTPTVDRVRDAVWVLVLGALGIAAVLGVAAATSLYGVRTNLAALTPVVVFLVSVPLLFPLFYVLPTPPVTAREVLPGTLFAATAWTGVDAVLGLYAASTDGMALYGLLGGLLLVVTWLYAAHLAILLGASLNAVVAGRVDPESIERE